MPTQYSRRDPQAAAVSGRRGGEQYLEAAVKTASPAKLRLMLTERAVDVASRLADHWRTHPPATPQAAVNEHSIMLLDLLSELLSGVTGKQIEVCRQVADLYVFLCKHLVAAQQTGDAQAIDEIGLILQTEAETWRMVCAQEFSAAHPAGTHNAAPGLAAGGLDLHG